MYTVLSTRRLLFDCSPERLVELAQRFDFDAVDAVVSVFRESPATRDRFVGLVADAGLRWGLAGLPVPLGTTTSDADFDGLLAIMGELAPSLADAGVSTVSAWLAPANDEADRAETFELHRRRLNRLAPVLADANLRLALEYVGPRTWRTPFRHPFISDAAGMRELIGSLEDPARFGLLLDTFHWYTAHESTADLLGLRADEILAVDLNDAPAGIDVDDQLDMERAQPGHTGVIDVAGFVGALRQIGYDGPVQSEPFSTALREQPEEQRVREARDALTAFLGAPR